MFLVMPIADAPTDSGEVLGNMMEAVTTALGTVLDWVGTVVTSLTTTNGELNSLLPLMAIGIAISALMLGVKAIKSFAWGT